jgi:hypothetical protein
MSKNIPLIPIVSPESAHQFCRQTDGTPFTQTVAIRDPDADHVLVHVNTGYLRTNQWHPLMKLSRNQAMLDKGMVTERDYMHDPIYLSALVFGDKHNVVDRIVQLEHDESTLFKVPRPGDNPNLTGTRVLKMRHQYMHDNKPVYVNISAEIGIEYQGGIRLDVITDSAADDTLEVIGFSLLAERIRYDPHNLPWMDKGANPIALHDVTTPAKAVQFLRHETLSSTAVASAECAMSAWIAQQEAEGRRNFAIFADQESVAIDGVIYDDVKVVRLTVALTPDSPTFTGLDILVIDRKLQLYYNVGNKRQPKPFVVF